MPQRKSGVEELRKNRTKRLHNLDIKTEIKKTVKKYLTSVQGKNKEEAQANLKLVYKQLDKAAKKNVLKKNTVSRRKSRFAKLLNTV